MNNVANRAFDCEMCKDGRHSPGTVHCKQCGAYCDESDTVHGYGVRCGCAAKYLVEKPQQLSLFSLGESHK